MADSEQIRISKVIKELNIGLDSALEFLSSKGVAVEKNPNSKIDAGAYGLLLGQFSTDKKAKDACDTYEKNAASNISNSGFIAVNADCTLK